MGLTMPSSSQLLRHLLAQGISSCSMDCSTQNSLTSSPNHTPTWHQSPQLPHHSPTTCVSHPRSPPSPLHSCTSNHHRRPTTIQQTTLVMDSGHMHHHSDPSQVEGQTISPHQSHSHSTQLLPTQLHVHQPMSTQLSLPQTLSIPPCLTTLEVRSIYHLPPTVFWLCQKWHGNQRPQQSIQIQTTTTPHSMQV